MKIGEALRQERLRLNLSQSQMAGDVLTKSFYSKVERNLCSIRANDLLSILSLHNIDYSYFFEKLKFENNDKELSETECNNLLHAAYYNNDWSKILKLQELIKQKDTNELNLESINAQIIVIKAAISDTLDKIPNDEKNRIKRVIFETTNWTENSLRLFAISMFIFDTDDINAILITMLNDIPDINSVSENKQKMFSAILINYLNYSLHHSKSIRKDNVYRSINRLEALSAEPKNCFAKIMANYYKCILKKDFVKCREILDFLKENGMGEIVEKI